MHIRPRVRRVLAMALAVARRRLAMARTGMLVPPEMSGFGLGMSGFMSTELPTPSASAAAAHRLRPLPTPGSMAHNNRLAPMVGRNDDELTFTLPAPSAGLDSESHDEDEHVFKLPAPSAAGIDSESQDDEQTFTLPAPSLGLDSESQDDDDHVFTLPAAASSQPPLQSAAVEEDSVFRLPAVPAPRVGAVEDSEVDATEPAVDHVTQQLLQNWLELARRALH